MAKPPQSGALNPLALRGVDLASLIGRSPVTDEKGQKIQVTPAAISNWVSRGNCPRNPDGTYNAIHVLAWLAAEHARIPYRPSAEPNVMEKAKLAIMREKKLAMRQARLVREGELVEKDVEEEERRRRIHAVKGGLLALERSLAREIVGVARPQAEAIIRGKVNDLLDGYAAGWEGEGDIPS